MSTLSMLLNMPMPALTLAGGLATTSYVLFANVGQAQMGIVPWLTGRLGPNPLSTRDRVVAWRSFFGPAAAWFITTSVLASILHFATAYTHPSPRIRRLALYAGVSSLLIGPITGVLLAPVNSQLFALLREDALRGLAEDDTLAVGARALLGRWEKMQWIRHVSYALGWGFSLAAVLTGGIQSA